MGLQSTVVFKMNFQRLFLFAGLLIFLPTLVWGQAFDRSVAISDPSIKTRVQDSDQPDNPLSFPGASGPWTGQLALNPPAPSAIAVQTGASRASQFPSLNGMSTWSGTSSGTSNMKTGGTLPQGSSVAQDRNPLLSASRFTKLTGSKKTTMVLSQVELGTSKTSHASDEFAQQELTDPKADLRKLKRAAQKTARVRITDPFQNKADAANAGRWHGTVLTARSMEQERHQESLRMLQGYTDETDRKQRRRRKRGTSRTVDYR